MQAIHTERRVIGPMKREEGWFTTRLFWKFFIPSLLSSIGLSVGAVADSIYVGRTLSESGLFVIGAASPVYMIFSTIGLGAAEGGSIHFATALSEGKADEARKFFFSTAAFIFGSILSLCILGQIFAGPLIALLGCSTDSAAYPMMMGYVRRMLLCSPVLFMQAPLQYFVHTDNDPKLASMSLVAGNIVDCVLGFVFIVILHMGVNGSIWSTVCGAVVMEGICLSHFFGGKGILNLKRPAVSLRKALLAFRTGLASSAQYIYQFLSILLFNRILLRISGEMGVAVYDIVINAGSLVTAVIDASVLALVPIVSTYFGERNNDAIRDTFKVTMVTAFGISLCESVVFGYFAVNICGIMGLSGKFLERGRIALILYLAGIVISSLNIVIAAFFQSIGKETLSYMITALRGLNVLLPAGFLLSKLGYTSFWMSFAVTELIVLMLSAAFMFYQIRIRRTQLLHREDKIFSRFFEGQAENISVVIEEMQAFLEELDVSAKKAYFVALAVDETCQLIAENGSGLKMQLTLIAEENEFILHIRDNATRFNPMDVSDEDEHGMGLRIVKNQARDFFYREFLGFNTLTITFEGDAK